MNMPTFLPKKLHLALCSGAAALFVAALPAHAAVISVTPAAPISIGNNIDGVYFNVVTGVSGLSGGSVPGWDINPYNNGAGLTFYGAASPSGVLVESIGVPATTSVAVALSFGSTISSGGIYNQFQNVGTNFQTAGDRYLGFRFINEGAGSILNYGWMLIRSGDTAGFPASIVSYGYENTGLSITAGQVAGVVPEPSTYAMFGLAFAAAAGWRRLKARRAA